ncbi:MAG: TA0938 family protein [Methanomassiliicoccales archaeon]
MEVNNKRGCSLCDATWGDYRAVVEGEERRFCCSTCAAAFAEMISAVKNRNGWSSIDKLEIKGNNTTGRKCTAVSGKSTFNFYIKFNDDGTILDFHPL